MRIVKFALLVMAELIWSPNPAAASHRIGHIVEKIPALTVRSAYSSFRSTWAKPDPLLAENRLRLFAIWEPDDVVARNLDWVRKSGWDAEFKAMFERAVTWVREVKIRNPEEIYRLLHEFRARPDAEAKRFDDLATWLLKIAAKRGHEKAKAENSVRMNRLMARKRVWTPRQHALLMDYLQKGDPGAMALLSDRYENGEGLERNLAKAYYWLLRARKGGEDVASGIRVLDRRISAADRERALKWFHEGTVSDL